MNELLNHYLGQPKRDWIGDCATFKKDRRAAEFKVLGSFQSEKVKKSRPSLSLEGDAGTYADPWYGKIQIDKKKDGRQFDFAVSAERQPPAHLRQNN